MPAVDGWVTKPVRKTLLQQAILGLFRTGSRAAIRRPDPVVSEPVTASPSATSSLLVETHPSTGRLPPGCWTSLGYSVHAVENGRLALEAVAENVLILF